VIVNTGQHYDENMSDIFFSELGILKPKYNLNIHGLSHGEMTGKMLSSIEKICMDEKPDWMLLYGDTNSTLAGALAASKLHIPIAHVESGLRSNNLSMPEEVNRIVTDRLSTLLFCPTEQAEKNLTREGYPLPCTGGRLQKIINVGDIMFDAVKKFSNKNINKASQEILSEVNGEYALATIHRPSNTDDFDNLKQIFSAFDEISKNMKVLFPIHPRTRKKVDDFGFTFDSGNVVMIEPVSYVTLQQLISKSKFVMTDSGGLQKEAYFHKKKCITLRDETEWSETVSSGWNTITGANFQKVVSAVNDIDIVPEEYVNYYGSGITGLDIISELKSNA
jgi:UDP-GlcNAc3NAcA epimerase